MARGGGARWLIAVTVVLAAIGLAVLLARPPSPGASAAPTAGPVGSTPGATSAPPSPGASAVDAQVFVGAGDIADCSSDGDRLTAAILDGLPDARVFTLGDNAYDDGTRRQFDECYGPTWGRHRDRTWPSPGNHDYRTSGASGYFEYFGERAGPDGRGWYAFDLGAWRVYSLNSNCEPIGGCGPDSPQVAWLRDDLAGAAGRCVLAYWHHPRFSSSEHGSDTSVDPLWDALYDAGAELVLAGHDHTYERFEPLDGDGELDRDRGITSFVVGTGGRRLYDFVDILPTSVARGSGVWGVLELTLAPDGWSSRFLSVEGADFTDQAAGTCR